MAITITDQPTTAQLTKNPIIYEINTDNYVNTAGVKAKKKFDFTTDPEDGDTFDIGASGVMSPLSFVTFVCSDTPSSVFQFAPRAVDQTIEDWIDNVFIPRLIAHPNIDLYFDVYRQSVAVVIEAKEYGPDYNIDELTPTGFTINVAISTTGVLSDYNTDLRVKYRVHLQNVHGGVTWSKSTWFAKEPELNGDLSVDVSSIVHEMYRTQDVPDVSITVPTRMRYSIRDMRVEFAETSGGDPHLEISTITPNVPIFKGGYSWRDMDYALQSQFITPKKFITNRGETHTWIESRDFLYFVCNHPLIESEEVELKTVIYYTDGTTYAHTINSTDGMEVGDLWCVPAGFKTNNLHFFEQAKTPYKYILWMQTSITEDFVVVPFTFLMDVEHHDTSYLQYFNSYGLLETRFCEGEVKLSSKYGRDFMDIPTPVGALANTSDQLPYNIQEDEYLNISTGVLEHQELMAAKEILLSEIVLWSALIENGIRTYSMQLIPDGQGIGQKTKDAIHVNALELTLKFNRSETGSYINKYWE